MRIHGSGRLGEHGEVRKNIVELMWCIEQPRAGEVLGMASYKSPLELVVWGMRGAQ